MAHYSVIKNLDNIQELVDNIGSYKHFNTLYSMYMNVLKGNKLSNYYSFMVGSTGLCATLTIGLVACIKTFSNTTDRNTMVQQYVENVLDTINKSHFEYRDYTKWSDYIDMFVNIFKKEEVPVNYEMDMINTFSDDDTYYAAQEKMHFLLNPPCHSDYHSEYINLMTLCYYPFLKIVQTMPNPQTRKQLIVKFLTNMVKINKDSDIHCMFDMPYDATIVYDFTKSD